MAIQNSLPGGVVFYAAYMFRQYRRFGADDVLAGWTLLALNVVSLRDPGSPGRGRPGAGALRRQHL